MIYRLLVLIILIASGYSVGAQQTPVFKSAKEPERKALRNRLINNVIISNLRTELSDSTEDRWRSAMSAAEVLGYRSQFVDRRIRLAFRQVEHRSNDFQRDLLELVYANYPRVFCPDVSRLLKATDNAKIFAMCANYVGHPKGKCSREPVFQDKLKKLLAADTGNVILRQTNLHFRKKDDSGKFVLRQLFQPDFLPGKTVMFSIQRKNRNYPGLVVLRDSTGKLLTLNGRVLHVQQLARSISGLPSYLTNGNTPQGIFRMAGFDTSRSSFIGPTTNIQLRIPYEVGMHEFFMDSALSGIPWDIQFYQRLLPATIRNNEALLETFFAGKAGRNEIIAHGTTVDPSWYRNRSFYPFTPTIGCLCTRELWSRKTGKLLVSDQKKLVTALTNIGGAKGYAVVIDIDDQKKSVTVEEILKLVPVNSR